MGEGKMIDDNKSSQITSDVIIEKFIPIIGAILLVSGIGYLLYTSVWIILPEIVRIIIGFIVSFGIIMGGLKLGEKLKYFGDIIIGIGVLLLYGTLIYGSRNNGIENSTIPEIASLSVSFIFTFIISYFANIRKSKVILILSLLGAYLTPFVIGQNDSWIQSISFNSYLIYFTAVNIVLFQMSKDLDLTNISPLNILGLFFGTSTLYKLSYYGGISNINNGFLSSDTFSAILFLILAIFSIWSLLIGNKDKENKAEGYLAIGYIGTVLWFMFNMSILSIPETIKAIFFIILSISCFIGWYNIGEQKTRYEHTALYAGGIFNGVLAFSILIPEINSYTSLLIGYIGLVFGGLYFLDNTKKERLLSYYLFSLIGALYSITPIIGEYMDFKTLYITLSLIPMVFAYFITKNDNAEIKDIAKVYSTFGVVVIFITLLINIVNFINFGFFIFYIIPLIGFLYIYFNNSLEIGTKIDIFYFILIWFMFGHFGTFFKIISDIYPAPLNTHIFIGDGLFSNWILIKGLFASIILFLGFKLSHKLNENYNPTYLVSILYYVSIFSIGNQLIFALINDLGISGESGGMRAISITLYWIILAIFLIFIGIKGGVNYKNEKHLGIILIFLTIIKIIFYDMATMDMNNKIIVLMIVGGLLLIFSYFIHKNGWLKSQESSKLDDNKSNLKIEDDKIYIINEKIKDVDVSNIENIKFCLNNKENFIIKSENLFKIAKIIVNKKQKTNFENGELIEIYNYIIKNYKSDLNKDDYNKLTSKIKDFIDIGGFIEINTKK
ncbi:MAG: DUF2339 domain-containing protein [Candidatus Gracilibacteria bacterium]|nr:DUF2339 domain-containing protein [Candidatus Gracilibacteria bacterium]